MKGHLSKVTEPGGVRGGILKHHFLTLRPYDSMREV